MAVYQLSLVARPSSPGPGSGQQQLLLLPSSCSPVLGSLGSRPAAPSTDPPQTADRPGLRSAGRCSAATLPSHQPKRPGYGSAPFRHAGLRSPACRNAASLRRPTRVRWGAGGASGSHIG